MSNETKDDKTVDTVDKETNSTDGVVNMINSIIDDKPEQAEVEFHSYLKNKMRDAVQGSKEE